MKQTTPRSAELQFDYDLDSSGVPNIDRARVHRGVETQLSEYGKTLRCDAKARVAFVVAGGLSEILERLSRVLIAELKSSAADSGTKIRQASAFRVAEWSAECLASKSHLDALLEESKGGLGNAELELRAAENLIVCLDLLGRITGLLVDLRFLEPEKFASGSVLGSLEKAINEIVTAVGGILATTPSAAAADKVVLTKLGVQ